MVVVACRDEIELETREEEQEELLRLPLNQQQQQLQPPAAPPLFGRHSSYSHFLRLVARALHSGRRRCSRSSLRRGRRDGSKIWL